MNLALNTVMHSAAPAAAAAAPAVAGTIPVAAELLALPFGHWITFDAALPEDAVAGAPQDGAAPLPGAEPGEPPEALEETVVPDMLMAAMAPLLAPAALPAMMLAMPGAKPGAKPETVDATVTAPASAPVAARVADTAAAALPDLAPVTAKATVAPAIDLPDPVAPPLAASVAVPVATARPDLVAASRPAADAAAPEALPDTAPVTPGAGVSAATGQGANARAADSIVLAGPPTAWRQSLHEALGERLQLQLGRNIEQATIRLDPPMLGRIEIAIRHSGGNLEVHIAASNTEVLRQLNTVSDSLRNDLAGRQYSSVAVNVTEVPRAQTGGQAGGQGGADAQGRPRQEQEQPRTPGLALNDAGESGSPFSMN